MMAAVMSHIIMMTPFIVIWSVEGSIRTDNIPDNLKKTSANYTAADQSLKV